MSKKATTPKNTPSQVTLADSLGAMDHLARACVTFAAMATAAAEAAGAGADQSNELGASVALQRVIALCEGIAKLAEMDGNYIDFMHETLQDEMEGRP